MSKDQIEELFKDLYTGPSVETVDDVGLAKLGKRILGRPLNEVESDRVYDIMDEMVRLESDNRNIPNIAGTSSAAGYLQLTGPTVQTASNSLAGMYRKQGKKAPEWVSKLKSEYSNYDGNTPKSVNYERITGSPGMSKGHQMSLALNRLLEKRIGKPGQGDQLWERAISGDLDAASDLYTLGHHTDPNDAATRQMLIDKNAFTKKIWD